MADLEAIIQPEEYRTSDRKQAPEWVFFPNLRLLFGWGDGLWETLGDRMYAVRTFFLIKQGLAPEIAPTPPGVQEFFDWLDVEDAGRLPMPFYARVLGAFDCALMRTNLICSYYAGQLTDAIHGAGAQHHPLEADEHYRVAHGVSEDRYVYLAIERRTKKLKPELEALRRGLGLDEAGRKAFADHVAQMKLACREHRIVELLTDPHARPPSFLVEAALQVRIRDNEVQRGKLDAAGVKQRPYTTEELIDRTANAIADTEATALVSDYAWHPVRTFDARGLTLL